MMTKPQNRRAVLKTWWRRTWLVDPEPSEPRRPERTTSPGRSVIAVEWNTGAVRHV